jgi:hypothetical protein
MPTATTTTTEAPEVEPAHIPEESETRGPGRWRVSDGALRRGPQEGGETRERIHGLLKRVGVYDGVDKNGEEYEQLEIDLELNGTLIPMKVNFKTMSSTMSAMSALLACEKDQLIIVEPNLGNKKNQHGRFPTYINMYKGKVKDGRVVSDGRLGTKFEGSWDVTGKLELLGELKKKDFYLERERKKVDTGVESAWDKLIDTISKGDYWRPIDQASQDAYLAFFSVVAQATPALAEDCKVKGKPLPFTSMADVPDSVFDAIRLGHDAAKAGGRPPKPELAKIVADAELF